MKNGKLTVAIVGMGFGSCFLPIYLKHPDVEHVIMVDTNPDQLKALADMYLLDESYYTTDFEAVLQNPDVDAVHLVIPPALHAPMSVQVLNAGKHCACTIPMGMSMKELEDVIKARKASGKHTGAKNRDVIYTDSMSGINWSTIPVTIIELGFMSNPSEDRLMATEDYRNKMAQGIVDGIDAYYE